MRFLYFGRVEDGVVQFYSPALFKAACEKLEGKQVAVAIDRVVDSRTNQQNRYYWGVIVKMISDATGHTPDEVHEILKSKFNPQHKAIVNPETGEIAEFNVGGSTAALTTMEFGNYIDQIVVWAATFLALSIPSPDEVRA